MGLRVFEDPEGRLLLEITSSELKVGRALFVPAIPEGFPQFANRDPQQFVEISFRQTTYAVPYLLVSSRVRDGSALRHVGELEATDSINILNHIVDLLAYPALKTSSATL